MFMRYVFRIIKYVRDNVEVACSVISGNALWHLQAETPYYGIYNSQEKHLRKVIDHLRYFMVSFPYNI